MYEFWDLNQLTISELDEIIHLRKARSLTQEEAMRMWMRDNPGRIKNLGSYDGEEFEHNEITMDGVKETKGLDALHKIIGEVMEDKNGI